MGFGNLKTSKTKDLENPQWDSTFVISRKEARERILNRDRHLSEDSLLSYADFLLTLLPSKKNIQIANLMKEVANEIATMRSIYED